MRKIMMGNKLTPAQEVAAPVVCMINPEITP